MILRYILFSLLVILSQQVTAQELQDSSKLKTWSATISVSSWVYRYAGPQIGLEKSFKNDSRLELEAAYILDLGTNPLNKPSGFRAIFGYKFNVDRNNFHFLVNLHYRHINLGREESFSRFNGAFFQNIKYVQEIRFLAPSVGITYLIPGKIFQYEFGASFGMGRFKITNTGIPEFSNLLNERNFFDRFYKTGTFQQSIFSLQCKFKFKVF